MDDKVYAAWHQEHSTDPVREQQFQGQVQAAKRHLQDAQFSRVVGNLPAARKSLAAAGLERSIAARMPRVR